MFGAIVPNSAAQVVSFLPWAIIDVFIVHATWKFGREQWAHAPMVARSLAWILGGGIVLMLGMFWTIIQTMGDLDQAGFYLAWTDQLIVSTTSVAQLMSRGNTGGHSWGIW
jgi:paspaline synthase